MEELIDFKVEPADDKPEMMAVTVSSRDGGDDKGVERTEFFFGEGNARERYTALAKEAETRARLFKDSKIRVALCRVDVMLSPGRRGMLAVGDTVEEAAFQYEEDL